jgi:hypothetical protein
MNSANETRLAIARITDTGHFEQLATAVLRAATPETYANLVHSGTNEVGKPVKSPVDGIGFIPGAKPRHMVVAHHTTSSRDALARKWLYTPETAKAQKAGKPKTPAGDVLKAIELARQEREHSPNLEVTLALTSNTEPTEDLIRNTARIAGSHNIHIDIWSGSRIAGFLDNDPNGQWLRSRFLGIDQERLSEELLRHLSRQSVTANAPPVAIHDQIARDAADRLIDSLPRPVGLLVSPSGYGKSVACHLYMQRTILQGGLALVLSHSILEESLIPETAIDAALRQLHPKLEPYVGQRALALATPENPVVLVVEDVSKSGQLALIMDRLLKWSAAASSKDNTVRWRIICPVWPELLATLSYHSQRELQSLSRLLGPFSPDEARAAVLKRATSIGLHVTPLDADVLATRLANDPLLIGLQNLRTSPDPINVIRDFVLHSLQRVAKTKGRVATDYLTALRAMSSAMLRSRILDPAWSDILCWLSDSPDHLQSIRELIHHAEIVQIRELTTTGELLQFRHDRVRHWLLSDSVLQAMLQNCLEGAIFCGHRRRGASGAHRSQGSSTPSRSGVAALSLLRVTAIW